MYDMETIIRLNEGIRQDLRHSQTKTLGTLFVSSFIVYYWFTALFDVFAKGYFPMSRSLMLLPPILNALSWVFWAAMQYVSFMRSDSRFRHPMDEPSPNEIVDEHQSTLYRYNRQKRVEALVSVIAAFQMFCMGLGAAYVIVR